MRYLILFMLIAGIFVFGKRSCFFNFGNGVSGSGPVRTEARDLQAFTSVNSYIGADIEVLIADHFAMTVSAQENILPLIRTEIVDGNLRIDFRENVGNIEKIKIQLRAPAFSGFSLMGSGHIKAADPIRADKMELSIGGSGTIELQQVELGETLADIAGSGTIVMNGKAQTLDVDIAGSGDVECEPLQVGKLDVSISGSGSVYATVAESINARLLGSGDVFYRGNPTVNSDVTGSGKVKRIE